MRDLRKKKVIEQCESSERDKLLYNLSNQPSLPEKTCVSPLLVNDRKEAVAKERD